MAQLVCGGCHTLLMYIRGATSVQCSCCHTVNLAMEGKVILQLFEIYSIYYISLLVQVRIKWYCHSKSGSTCELWQLPHAVDVPIWGTISEMCSVQFCDSGRGKYKILFSIKSLSFYAAANDELVF